MKRLTTFPLIMLLFIISTSTYGELIRISDEGQYNDELTKHKRMLVAFAADWCSVCNGIKEPLKEVANDPEFKHVAFAHVDVDKLDTVSKQNGIVGVPTFVYVENGNKKVEEIGVQNMPDFKDHLRTNLRKTFQVAQNDTDMELITSEPTEVMDVETVAIDDTTTFPAAEPNIVVRIINGIKDAIMMVIAKIKAVFTSIIDAIKGFFGK